MTNKSMVSAQEAREKRLKERPDEKDLGNEAAPDSPQLSPQIDERRTRLQRSKSDPKSPYDATSNKKNS